MPERVVTKCPVCGAPLRINEWLDEPGNVCEGSNEMICNRISDCEHYRWVPVGNACLNHPDDPVCEGVEWLLNVAIDRVYDGATVWLLIPNIADVLKKIEKAHRATVEAIRLLVRDDRLRFLEGVKDELSEIESRLAGLSVELRKKYFMGA